MRMGAFFLPRRTSARFAPPPSDRQALESRTAPPGVLVCAERSRSDRGAASPRHHKGGSMNSLNSILVEGNLVRDPAVKTTPTGSQVCDFTLATNRFYKSGEEGFEKEVSYFDIEAWSRLGTACSQNLKKGRGVRVVGRLKQDRWVDPEGEAARPGENRRGARRVQGSQAGRSSRRGQGSRGSGGGSPPKNPRRSPFSEPGHRD